MAGPVETSCVDTHWMKRKVVACVDKIWIMCHLKIYTTEKSLILWIYLFLIFTQVSTFQKYKIYRFNFHMYAFLGKITVGTLTLKHSNVVENINMCYVIVIMLTEWLLVLHSKYGWNTMAEINLRILG